MKKELLEEEYRSALADLESVTSVMESLKAQEKEVRTRLLSLMTELKKEKPEKWGSVLVQRVKNPGSTDIAMSDIEFALKYPHLCAPKVAKAKAAAKDDPVLRDLIIETKGVGYNLRVVYQPLSDDA